MELEKLTLSLSTLCTIGGSILAFIYGLVKIIFSYFKKDFNNLEKDYKNFKEEQIKENSKNYSHRHKYDKFDQTVNQLVEQTEKSLSNKIDTSISSLSKSIETINNNVTLILTHLLKKNER